MLCQPSEALQQQPNRGLTPPLIGQESLAAGSPDAAHAKLQQYGGICRLRICGSPEISVVQTHTVCGRLVSPASFGLGDLFGDDDEVSASESVALLLHASRDGVALHRDCRA